MLSEQDRSAFLEPLPSRPNLEMQQKRAKELLRAAWAGDAQSVQRFHVLHPRPPAPDALTLADAQLVVARGYGFENWAALKRKIESLTKTPVERFLDALDQGEVEPVRSLLERHVEVRAAVNEPIGHFNSRPASIVKKNLPLLDLLIAYGADLNLKSTWWAGGFGILEYDCTREQAAPLIERGAVVDVFAAAHLGMFDRVRELVEADPGIVHARGGDGKTPLHCARTVEIARNLLDHGAALDVRDIDHESTAAQYLVREAPDVARLLVDRGAWFDIFIAVGLHDAELVERCLRDDPEALDHRTGQGKYKVAHNGKRAATPEEIGPGRGDIYRWVFDANITAIEAAGLVGDEQIFELLMRHASPAQRLLTACARGDRAAAESVVASNPRVVATLRPDQHRVIADSAASGNTAAVELMLDLDFDTRATGHDGGDALHWASFHGNAPMVRALLQHAAAIGERDRNYHGTPLDWCFHGSMHSWKRSAGDYPATVELLLDAGERFDANVLPTGRDDVDTVLRAYLLNKRN